MMTCYMLPEDFGDAGLHPLPHKSQTTVQTQAHILELFMKFRWLQQSNKLSVKPNIK